MEAFSLPAEDIELSSELMAQIEDAAIITQGAKLLGLDWEAHYLRFMGLRRQAGTWNQREYDAMGLWYGALQAKHVDRLEAALRDEAVRQWLTAEFERRVRVLKRELGEDVDGA